MANAPGRIKSNDFYVQKRQARQGINPQTKKAITIAASKVPKFTAGLALKNAVK